MSGAVGVDQCESERKRKLRQARQARFYAKHGGQKEYERKYRNSATGKEKIRTKKARFYEKHGGQSEYERKYRRTAEGLRAHRRAKLLQKYGLTLAQYDKLFALQDGKCVGCGRPPKTKRLAVEHDHHTGRVRGLACHNCNRHLIAKNTAETARWLVAYLSSDFDGRNL